MASKITSLKKIASLGRRDLRITEMNEEEKYDLRVWKNEKYEDGVRFTYQEMFLFCSMIKTGTFTMLDEKKLIEKDGNDIQMVVVNNGRTYARTICTVDESEVLLKIHNDCIERKIKYCDWEEVKEEPKAKRGRPAKKVEETVKNEETKTEETVAEEKKSNIIQFTPRKEKPEITDKLVTQGNFTYDECEIKLNNELEIYKDSDSQYVIIGIKELCKVDSDFRNNVMREDKNFLGALQYMAEMCKKGYGDKLGNVGYSLDRDAGLGMAIDYYNSKPEEKPKTEKKEITKKGRKKKGA